MNAKTKSTLFAIYLVVTNWHWSQTVECAQSHGSTTINVDGTALGVFACVMGLILFSRRLYDIVRNLLNQGIRVPIEAKFISTGPMFILLFLLPGYSRTFSAHAGETTTLGYSSEMSGVLLVLAVLLMAIYQFYRGLKEYAKP